MRNNDSANPRRHYVPYGMGLALEIWHTDEHMPISVIKQAIKEELARLYIALENKDLLTTGHWASGDPKSSRYKWDIAQAIASLTGFEHKIDKGLKTKD